MVKTNFFTPKPSEINNLTPSGTPDAKSPKKPQTYEEIKKELEI